MVVLQSVMIFSQIKSPRIMGWYTTVDANIGYDLADIIRTSLSNEDDIIYENQEFGRFNYGFSAQIGFQPIRRFSLSAGFRYSYITPNFHLLYNVFQANYFINLNQSEDFDYIFLKGGSQMNKSAVDDAGFIGIGYGKIEPLGKHFGHQYQIFMESQVHHEGTWFIGVSYGITLFNKKL